MSPKSRDYHKGKRSTLPPPRKIEKLEGPGWGRPLASPGDAIAHYYYPPAVDVFGPYWYSACAKSTTTEAPAADRDRKTDEKELPGMPKKNLVVLSAKQIDGRVLR